jgi:hypothetical protein
MPGKVLSTTSTYTIATGDLADTMKTVTQAAPVCTGVDSGPSVAGTPDTQKYVYRLRNDSLLVQNDGWTVIIFPDQIIAWTLEGVKMWYVFVGGDAAGGIAGTWNLVGAVPAFGPNVTLGQVHTADSIIAARDSLIQSIGMTITISGGQLQVFYPMKFADNMVGSWTTCRGTAASLDTCNYSIAVTKVNDNEVIFTGNKSKSTATIVEDGYGDLTYTSSNPEYGPHTYFVNPVSCPDQQTPVWWNQFISSNHK